MPHNYRYVHTYTDARGKLRHQFRFKGRKLPLPKVKGSPEFDLEYDRLLEAALSNAPLVKSAGGAKRTIPGSFDALVGSYYQSSDFTALSASTKTTYRGIMERLREAHGHKLVHDLLSRHVRDMLNAKAATPAAANNMLRMLKLLMRHAVENDWRKDDPTYGVRPVANKTDGFHTWTEEEIAQFEAKHPLGTRPRLALDLLLYSGQRRSDVIRMGWQHVTPDGLDVRQQKTGTKLVIPIGPTFRRALDHASRTHLTFLTTRNGAAFTAAGFGNWFRDECRAAGLPDECAAHGLRKAACRRLAEDGCSANEIMSISGHKSLKEVERYTRAADQKRLAASAAARRRG